MPKYDYIRKEPLGGWILEVRKGDSIKGNIRKNRTTGRYQFFRGSRNAIRPMLEETDIEILKEQIEKLDF